MAPRAGSPPWLGGLDSVAWPAAPVLAEALRGLGIAVDSLQTRAAGGRTLQVVVNSQGLRTRLGLLRRRDPDPRLACPLLDERRALEQVGARCPGLVPQLLGAMASQAHGEMLAVAWLAGRRVASPHQLERDPGRVLQTVGGALATWHAVGQELDLAAFSRHVDVERVLQRTAASPLRGSFAPHPTWDAALARVAERIRHGGMRTLLHGDPHGYNLLVTPNGPCWLDLERLCVGPAEFDLAQAWVLAQAQSRRALPPPLGGRGLLGWQFCAAVAFLDPITTGWDVAARAAVSAGLSEVGERLFSGED